MGSEFAQSSASPPLRHFYEFGPYRLDVLNQRLLRDGVPVPVTPKAFDTLLLLVRRRERVVGKGELMRDLWPDAVVEEANLSQNIFTLRKILGAGPSGEAYIETVPRRGYRFAAEVREVVEEAALTPMAGTVTAGEARIELDRVLTTSSRLPIAVAAGLVLGVVLVTGWALSRFGTPSASGPAQYVPLTDFADSAVSPALSPDGRMLAFIRGQNTFVGGGQVYVKLLPNGEPVQLTHDDLFKMSPAFSPDGARIAYTVSSTPSDWSTWVVPVLGGQPTLMLSNATGLTWVRAGESQPRILFSELQGKGTLMAVVTSTESRSETRDVYVPLSENGMAHRSSISPNGKWVLLAEMDRGTWLPCRLVSYDARLLTKPVGPAPAQCTEAAWSPDGAWMYFSANTGNGFHIWRQRFPPGAPEQITSGATEEEGVAFAPDGRSLVTSVGTSQSTIWISDSRGERQISSQGYGLLPSFSPDGKKLYYLLRSGGSRSFVSGELWMADLESRNRERLLPDFLMEHYDISRDGRRVAFVRADAAGNSPVWVAPLDGRSAPRRVTSLDALRVLFRTDDELLFVEKEKGQSRFLYRVRDDGGGLQKAIPDPVVFMYSVAPDGKWVAVWAPGSSEQARNSLVVYPVDGGAAITICNACATGGGPDRGHLPPLLSWSSDGTFLYLLTPGDRRSTYAVPLQLGQALPALPAGGIRSVDDASALPGARLISQQAVFPGPSPSVYAFSRVTTQRNIYRIPVP